MQKNIRNNFNCLSVQYRYQMKLLAHQPKKENDLWESPRSLVVPPFSEYSVFYHRLTVDRLGRLFLSYDCWSTYWFYRTDHPGDRRALMMSPDGGSHWKLAEKSDLVRFILLWIRRYISSAFAGFEAMERRKQSSMKSSSGDCSR